MSIEFSPAFDSIRGIGAAPLQPAAPVAPASRRLKPQTHGRGAHPPKRPSGKRLAANRRNAKRSTGPRTAAGKRRSSQNALKHGLCSRYAVLDGECPATYAIFVREIEEELQPRTTMQRALLPHLANLMWRLDRLPEAQVRMFKQELGKCAKNETISSAEVLARRFSDSPTDNGFLLIGRYEGSLRAQLNRLMTRYEWLKKNRPTMPLDEDELWLERQRRDREVDAYVAECARRINAETAAERAAAEARAKQTQSKPNENPVGVGEAGKCDTFDASAPTERTQRDSDSKSPRLTSEVAKRGNAAPCRPLSLHPSQNVTTSPPSAKPITAMPQARRTFLPLSRLTRLVALTLLAAAATASSGCVQVSTFVPAEQRKPIDRALVSYPGGVVLEEVVRGLTAPVDCDIDEQGNLIVAESGAEGRDPRIIGYRPDGTSFLIYPTKRKIIFPFDVVKVGFWLHGKVGGICVANGKVYVSHRDADGMGVVTAFDYDGNHSTVIANLPARGDNGMSDLVLRSNGRLWFGVGSATNSGVVGLDNWPWIKKYPDFADRSFVDLKLNGYHFKSKNPDAGLFGGPEIAVTAPFQSFNVSSFTRIKGDPMPTGAIYSVDAAGGTPRVEAHGIRAPRGLALNPYGILHMTNGGMELRGTRPIKDDPDALLRVASGAWYGFPDFSTDLVPVTDSRFQLAGDMRRLLVNSGYDEISFLIDRYASNRGQGLIEPAQNQLITTFPSLSGAERFDYVPKNAPLPEFVGNAIVPLSGDRGPFATSGKKLVEPVGFKLVRFDPLTRTVTDFIANARGKPASLLPSGDGLIERPAAAKFAPDGSLYIVDAGRNDVRPDGRDKYRPNTGRVLRLRAIDATSTSAPATRPTPTTEPAPDS
jgi:glucose/arabinose dehydrogenase